ncbi:unnamed protein product [Trichogramma brassicae]|uniref:Uncharacterized protein n=1 Tax=Trichogramma brassicae TaxID=86971 RepID=A0A6H5IP57_9HYME|nr:unnamed protein product [Trichogramma brassicae]
MKPDEAAERLAYEDYYEFACSEKFLQFRSYWWATEACVDHLCERLTRGLLRRCGDLRKFVRQREKTINVTNTHK